jgi:DNA-3-methyladenine glycosylase
VTRAAPPLGAAFFARSVHVVAPELVGCVLLVDGVGGPIVECEAYDRLDPASHSFGGRSRRNASMFAGSGRAYVYRSYGVHWLLNLVCGAGPDDAEAVLIRAIEPTRGVELMQARRGTEDLRRLCAGPGRLAQALAIGPDLDGAPIGSPRLTVSAGRAAGAVVQGPRVGLTKGVERPWRYALEGSPFVSRPWPWASSRPRSSRG